MRLCAGRVADQHNFRRVATIPLTLIRQPNQQLPQLLYLLFDVSCWICVIVCG